MAIVIFFVILAVNSALHLFTAKQKFDLQALFAAFSSTGIGTLLAYIYFMFRDPNIALFGAENARIVLVHFALIVTLICLLSLVIFSCSPLGRVRFVKKAKPRTWRTYIFALFTGGIGFLFGLIYFLPRWAYRTFGKITPDQIAFALTQDLSDSSTEINISLFGKVILPIIASTLIGIFIGLINRNLHLQVRTAQGESASYRFKYLRATGVFFMLLGIVFSSVRAMAILPIKELIMQSYNTSDYFEKNYINPKDVQLTFPEKKKNLIHIYLESMENSYYSQELGGYEPVNLMPDLAQLTQEGISFSHTDKLGGARSGIYGGGHSIAGMVNMHAGVPFLASSSLPLPGTIDKIDKDKKQYPNFPTLGDILEKQGYRNVFMLGADSNWGQLGDYYRKHGNFEVWDLQTAYDEGVVPEGYKVKWGIEDEKLYAEAKKKMMELGNGDQPFYFILENADTHFPDGYVSPKYTELPFEKPYANAIYFSQKETVELVRWIQAQPWAKDTVIVLTGDHRSMEKKFFEGWDPNYYRSIVNLYLNTAHDQNQPEKIVKNRDYGAFDIFPTIVSALGIEITGERLGLGTNLFSGIPTIVERDGEEFINNEFNKRAPFFMENREIF